MGKHIGHMLPKPSFPVLVIIATWDRTIRGFLKKKSWVVQRLNTSESYSRSLKNVHENLPTLCNKVCAWKMVDLFPSLVKISALKIILTITNTVNYGPLVFYSLIKLQYVLTETFLPIKQLPVSNLELVMKYIVEYVAPLTKFYTGENGHKVFFLWSFRLLFYESIFISSLENTTRIPCPNEFVFEQKLNKYRFSKGIYFS